MKDTGESIRFWGPRIVHYTSGNNCLNCIIYGFGSGRHFLMSGVEELARVIESSIIREKIG